MNRRQALAALVALPAVSRISRADLRPDDVLVVECDEYISQDTGERIKATFQEIWPGRKIAIFDKGLRLKVLGTSDA